MTDWKKISLIVGTVVAAGGTGIAIAQWALNKYETNQEIKRNSAEAPLIGRRLDLHELKDTLKDVRYTNALNNLNDKITLTNTKLDKVTEALEENNRLRQWEKFNIRKQR